MTDTTVDLVVLGGGSAGYAIALRAAELGSSVVLIEKDKLGGTCLHRGCVPTKTLLHAAEVADDARDGAAFGLKTTFDGVDVPGLHKYKDGIVTKAYKRPTVVVKSRGITVVEGEGKFVGPNSVIVGDDKYIGTNVVLATGSYSRSLPGLNIEGRVITSEQALGLQWIPEFSAIVLGGGVIGVEFASVWASFGTKVTIVEALPSLVPAEDPWAQKLLERAFRKRKVAFSTGIRFAGVTQDDSGVTVTLEDGKTFSADLLLVAVGRGAATAGCGFEEAGLNIDRGFVITDERLRTNLPECLRRRRHRSRPAAGPSRVPARHLRGRGDRRAEPRGHPAPPIPIFTYCDPQIASVGLTEAKAAEVHGADNIETFVYDLAGNPKSQILRTAGGVKAVRVKNGPVIGIHLVGARVGDLIGEAQTIVGWVPTPRTSRR